MTSNSGCSLQRLLVTHGHAAGRAASPPSWKGLNSLLSSEHHLLIHRACCPPWWHAGLINCCVNCWSGAIAALLWVTKCFRGGKDPLRTVTGSRHSSHEAEAQGQGTCKHTRCLGPGPGAPISGGSRQEREVSCKLLSGVNSEPGSHQVGRLPRERKLFGDLCQG